MFNSKEGSKSDFPLTDALKKQRRSQLFRFHVPSHTTERASLGCYEYDFTELSGLDNLFNPEDVIARSQEKSARFFKAHKTYYIVNGSSAGLIAALFSLCRQGDNVLIGGNFHRSVASALVFCGASPFFIPVEKFLPEIPLNINLKNVELLIGRRNFKAIIITSPSYWGITPNLKAICRLAKEKRIPVLVDEAHGGHFIFDERFPVSASEAGADIWVNSAHKTMGALTPGALLHCAEGNVDYDRLESALAMIQTSSPSYAVMASLEMVRKQGKNWDDALEVASYGRDKLKDLKYYSLLKSCFSEYGFSSDPLRITIIAANMNISGFELKNLLSDGYGIETEMAGYTFLTFLVHRGHKKHDIDTLYGALSDIEKRYCRILNGKTESGFDPAYSLNKEMNLAPREASDSPWVEVALKEAAGRVAASTVSAFPPGIPALIPGQLVHEEIKEAIYRDFCRGYFFTGMKTDGELRINVVKE